jgi:hypothetical protein
MTSFRTYQLIPVKNNHGSRTEASHELLERRKRGYCALCVHACIMIENLPSGFDFWSKFTMFRYDKLPMRIQPSMTLLREGNGNVSITAPV